MFYTHPILRLIWRWINFLEDRDANICRLKEQGFSQGDCLVESDELERIAQSLVAVHCSIPFTILAFFPEYCMKAYKSPSVREMVEAYHKVEATGLKNIRLGNVGVFARSEEDQEYLMENVDEGVY